jgi:2-methylisocitrate lyase-like PEP mutase family enzyme
VVIEDKTGSKKNSFISTGHTRESVENFCNKIKSIEALQNNDFMILEEIKYDIRKKNSSNECSSF